MSIYHQILNVPITATKEEIKRSYKKLCKIYHPDINNNDSTQKMALINDAYDQLVKKSKKKKHIEPEINTHEKSSFIVQYKDQAYAFYKQGVKYYDKTDLNMSIGRNYYQSNRKSMFSKRNKFVDIYDAIMKSLYYFNIICIQFSDSVWYDDAIVKIRMLNRRKQSIKKWL